jgi:hypothetical protein
MGLAAHGRGRQSYDPTRQSYDLIGRGYATDRSPRVKADGTGRDMRCPNRHQDTLAFNTLSTV